MISPQLELEYSVLGSIIDDEKSINEAAGILTPESFSDNDCSEIFSAMLSLSGRGNPIDEISLKKELSVESELPCSALIDSLTGFSSIAGDVTYYSKLIQENWTARELSKLGENIHKKADDRRSSVNDLLEDTQNEIYRISNRSKVSTPKTLKDILPAVYKKLELQSSPDFNPIKTGYTDIDKLMYLDPGTYIVLAARPSMGKTSLATSMMTFIAESNPEKYCLFFSIEMRSENIVSKILSQHSKVDLRNVRTGELRADDWDKLAFSTDRMSAMSNLIIIDNPAITVHNMQTIAMNYATKKGISAIFVDFMQIIQPPTHTLKHGRVEEMTAISSGLKQMSRVLDVPLIALSQLSREVEKRGNKKPVNSDLRDSGSIEQDADVICFIYRDEVYYDDSPHKGIAELLFRKNREGPTGKVRLCYTGKYTKFTNINEPVYGV